MIKAIIIEDEKPAARRLERLLKDNDIDVLVQLYSVKQSIDWFESNEAPDLVFLDIQLSDGLSFEIFERVVIKAPVIFTTAYDTYTLKAFKLNSLDYLLKPIDEDELKDAIKKFKNVFASQNPQAILDLSTIQKLFQTDKSYKERLTIYTGSHIKMIEVTDISCICSEDKITHCYTKEGHVHVLDENLEQTLKQLNPKLFFRVNRKQIVHIKSIKEIVYYSNHRLQVKMYHYNTEPIIVSRERVKEFKAWLEN